MFEPYQIIRIDDTVLEYRVKYKYLVMKYCGADSHQKPIYRLCRQERTEAKAREYIARKKA